MHSHGPNCLAGPLSRKRRNWTSRPRKGTKPHAERADRDAPIRFDLVNRVRREIASGQYDTPEKWAMALDRLLREMDEA